MSKWDSGLCSCLEDLDSCCLTFFFPCCQYGYNSKGIAPDNGFCVPCILYCLCLSIGCYSCYGGSFRSDLRKKYNLASEPMNDCCVHFFCSTCAICQEAREIKVQKRKYSGGGAHQKQHGQYQSPSPLI